MKNIYLAYTLAFLKNSYFWFGIWVLYYLSMTNYQGIGLVETTMIILMISAEIPTGAIADLFGRKKTLLIAFILMGLGQIYMGFAHTLRDLILSVSVTAIGHSFYSGTLEALVYDTLKENNRENIFDKINANLNSISLVGTAIASIIGGILYVQHPALPFILNGVTCFIGLLVAFFLVEPQIDSDIFNLKNYIHQTKNGFIELYRSVDRVVILNTLLIASVIVITYEVVNNVLLVEYGLSPLWLGIMGSTMSIVAAISTQIVPVLLKKRNIVQTSQFTSFIYGLSLLFSGISGWIGVSIVVFRNGIENIYSTLNSIILNKEISSKNRATTISTFNMVKSIPYAVVAVLAGKTMDDIGTVKFAIILGIIVLIIATFFKIKSPRHLSLHSS